MNVPKRPCVASLLLVAGWSALLPSRAHAQATGPIGTLGGYGGPAIGSYYTSRGAAGYVPYGGTMGGYVPYGGTGLGVVPQAPRRIAETPVGGASLMMYGFREARMGPGRPRSFTPYGYQGAPGMRGGTRPMAGRADRGAIPPGITYPFREPPSLTGPSMSMP